jgi:hypothetical protein
LRLLVFQQFNEERFYLHKIDKEKHHMSVDINPNRLGYYIEQ